MKIKRISIEFILKYPGVLETEYMFSCPNCEEGFWIKKPGVGDILRCMSCKCKTKLTK